MATASVYMKGSDDYIDAKCDICAKQNTEEIADCYCYNCLKHMCASCLGIHNHVHDDHNVVKGKLDDKDVLTEKCGKHSDELITVYCRKRDELLCRTCQLLDHRSVMLFHYSITIHT